MQRRSQLAFLVVSIFLIVGCQTQRTAQPEELVSTDVAAQASAVPQQEAPGTIDEAATDGAVVTGRVILQETGETPVGTAVMLAEVFRQGDQASFVLDVTSSPSTLPDEQGTFTIEGVEAGEYVVVVGDPAGEYDIILDASGKAKVWTVAANEILDIGEVEVEFVQ